MKKGIIIFVLLFSTLIYSQSDEIDPMKSESILATERDLDKEIVRINRQLTNHARLLSMKIKVLPSRTVMFKGIAEGDRCKISNDQESSTNNCIHLEVYDFIDSDKGKSNLAFGPKNKTMVLFFQGEGSEEKDPSKIPPRPLARIFSKVYMEEFKTLSKIISEITDESPGTDPLGNENVYLFYQVDGFPFHGTEETPSEKGIGRYSLEVVTNTKSFDIRNSFKKRFYIKHLDYFDKLYTKIYNFNNRGGNRHYEKNIQFLKDSLEY